MTDSHFSASKKTILVVDDNPDIVTIAKTILESKGFEVQTAFSGPEAFSQLEEIKPDLIILDVMMPQMDGLEVLRKLREIPDYSSIPVILLTAKVQYEDVLKGYKLGDRARNRRLQAVFGTDWRDPNRYDFVINIAQMTLDTACYLIVEAVRREDYQPTADSEQAFQDLLITSRVQAALITSPKTRNLTINVQVQKGEAFVSGILAQSELEQEITEIAKGVQGVNNVVADFESPPIEYMYP